MKNKQIKDIIKKFPFENDEDKKVKVEVKIQNFMNSDCLTIRDIQTSRGSEMTLNLKYGIWHFNRNFWLNQNNLKLLNEINDLWEKENK